MTNILITGGNGFIGSHLADHLSNDRDHEVTIIDLHPRSYGGLPPRVNFIQGNIGEFSLMRQTLKKHNIQIVYHASWANIPETALKSINADINTSLQASVTLLNACCETGVKRVIFLSSGGAVYGISKNQPINETHPTDPISPYGVTKLAVEKYLQMYFHLYGLEYVILRPSAPYGPRQIPNQRRGVISEFIYHVLKREALTIWGDGNQIIRDFFYIDDLVKAMGLVKDIPLQKHRIFNLSGYQKYSLNEIIQTIQIVLKLTPIVYYDTPRSFDIPYLHLDISLAAKVLGWQPQTHIEEGIVRTADWIKQNIK